MAEFKLVISDPETGKTVQKEIGEDQAGNLVGMRVGETLKGDTIGLHGYEFRITGGSDYCGFPMRADVEKGDRKKILAVSGVGINNKKKPRGKDMKYMRKMKGMRQRVTVASSRITEKTSQINAVITKKGKENLFEGAKPEAESGQEAGAQESQDSAAGTPEKGKEAADESKQESPKQEEDSGKSPEEPGKVQEKSPEPEAGKQAEKNEEKPAEDSSGKTEEKEKEKSGEGS
ncbi:MAG: S6e family ribosomal protein [Candidatus Woesearchaeota archaeon]